MGTEFTANGETNLLSTSYNKIRNFLKSSELFQVLGDNEKEIKFRWTSRPFDDKWPEDAMLQIESDHLYLLIHGATGQQIEALLNDVNSLESGVTFEEIE